MPNFKVSTPHFNSTLTSTHTEWNLHLFRQTPKLSTHFASDYEGGGGEIVFSKIVITPITAI